MKKLFLSLLTLTTFLSAEEFQPSSFEDIKKDFSQIEIIYNPDKDDCSKTVDSFNNLFETKLSTNEEAISLFQKIMINESCSVEKLQGADMTKIYCKNSEITFLFFDSIENCEAMTKFN